MKVSSLFKIKKVEEKTLGKIFRERRIKLGLKINYVSEKLRISEANIKSLEKDDYYSLPPEVYVKGFITRYSNFLGLDPKETLFLYQLQKKYIKTEIPHLPKKLISHSRFFDFVNYKTIFFLFVFIVSLTVVFYLFKAIYPLYAKPFFILNNPSNCPIETSQDMINLEGRTQPESKVWINGEEVFIDKEGKFNRSVYLKPGDNPIQFRLINKFKKEREEGCLIKRK